MLEWRKWVTVLWSCLDVFYNWTLVFHCVTPFHFYLVSPLFQAASGRLLERRAHCHVIACDCPYSTAAPQTGFIWTKSYTWKYINVDIFSKMLIPKLIIISGFAQKLSTIRLHFAIRIAMMSRLRVLSFTHNPQSAHPSAGLFVT
jgi:hypothetical protein